MTKARKGFLFPAPVSCVFYQKVLLGTFYGKGFMQFSGLLLCFPCMAEFLYDGGAGAARRLFILLGHRELVHEFFPGAPTSIKTTHTGVLKM